MDAASKPWTWTVLSDKLQSRTSPSTPSPSFPPLLTLHASLAWLCCTDNVETMAIFFLRLFAEQKHLVRVLAYLWQFVADASHKSSAKDWERIWKYSGFNDLSAEDQIYVCSLAKQVCELNTARCVPLPLSCTQALPDTIQPRFVVCRNCSSFKGPFTLPFRDRPRDQPPLKWLKIARACVKQGGSKTCAFDIETNAYYCSSKKQQQ